VKESEINKAAGHIKFAATCEIDFDSVVKDAERVRMIVDEIWKITDFRFT
jgi:hypothetical protein